MRNKSLLSGVGALAAAPIALCALDAQAQAQADWRAALVRDAQALHDTYLDSHPGAVDPENPAFKTSLAAGLSRAEARARTVTSYGGYWWALREYSAAFNDAHVFVDRAGDAPKLASAWPGFLTRETSRGQTVAVRSEPNTGPPLGAVLVSCNGVSAETLLEQNVGRFRGRWALESQRQAHAWRLFLDAGNPFAQRPTECAFQEAGGVRSYALKWSPLSDEELALRAEKVSTVYRAPVELRRLRPGALWISLGSFTADGASEPGRQLEAVAKELEKSAAEIAGAHLIVLDVRGNTGGSSGWGKRIAAAIWGAKNAQAAAPQSEGVDWRPSTGNIAELKSLKQKPGTSFRLRVWADHIIGGMNRAKAAGRPLWRETALFGGLLSSPGHRSPRLERVGSTTSASVYVLTDGACVSACLDALDVWKALGAVQVGRETSADSLYMEIRRQLLPSGRASISVPMKVYRGRPRGANQPYRPAHKLHADVHDTSAVEAEIVALARGLTAPTMAH
jgi:hypothetical protein